MKKYAYSLLFLSGIIANLSATAQIDNLSSTSVLVCRAHQCANAPYSMTKGFLFNKIAQMMEQNVGKNILVCEADPNTHICLKEGISVPADTSFAPVLVTIQNLKLADEKKLNGATGLDLVLDYRVKADKTYPSCQLALSRLMVNYTDQVELTSRDFICNITETGRTSLNATYNIDYLDFDYGFIGAYYTIGIGEAVQGDKTGYALFRFTANPPVITEGTEALSDSTSMTVEVVPEILQETIPEVSVQEEIIQSEPTIQQVSVPLPTPSAPATVVEAKPIRVVPEIVIRQEPAPSSQSDGSPQPTVIKTTTIEKMVITSDGKRQITPPETRTIFDGTIEHK
ncbi:MAG: hypothetical protein SPL08_03305 [Pseudomonadota bacterium]|nr:hypothetical protein [Pseudomonadota bacterium]